MQEPGLTMTRPVQSAYRWMSLRRDVWKFRDVLSEGVIAV